MLFQILAVLMIDSYVSLKPELYTKIVLLLWKWWDERRCVPRARAALGVARVHPI
jgi:hypothetical protein